MSKDLIASMVQLQNKFNSKLNPSWVSQNWQWDTAIIVEIAECLDHLSPQWKWWKKDALLDLNQVKLELIDILHFAISWQIVQCEGSIEEVQDIINRSLLNSSYSDLPADTCVEALKLLLSSVSDQYEDPTFDWSLFFCICSNVNLNIESIYKMYISKNALNLFRQNHGYNSGSYIKYWGGKEDNEVLAEILDNLPLNADLFDNVTMQLEINYPH